MKNKNSYERKHQILKLLRVLPLFLSLLIITPISSPAQNGDPPPPPGEHGQNGNQVPGGGAPIGDGLLILCILASAFALRKKFAKKTNSTNEQLTCNKIAITILMSLFTIPGIYATNISASGNISSNTTWSGVDTVKVTGDIYVNNGISLTIDPGIFVVFQGHYKLEVDGTLLAVGTKTDTITFTIADTSGIYNHTHTGWNRIVFDQTSSSNDSSKVIYCKLEYGKANSGGWQNMGGAMSISDFNKLLVTNSAFIKNRADSWGGGIYCSESDIIIKNCNFNNNHAGYLGGGLLIEECNALLVNNIIKHNQASNGGGIYFAKSNTVVINNSIVNNSDDGIFCGDDSDPIFKNTIIYGNYWAQVYLNDNNDDPDFYYCDVMGGTGSFGGIGGISGNFNGDYENCIDSNPQFVGSGEHPFDLSLSSPCINAGDTSTTTNDTGLYDAEGVCRILNTIIDIGAYEQAIIYDSPGHSLEFDGLNDFVSIPSDASLNTPQFTVEFWVQTTNPGEWQGIIDKGVAAHQDWIFLTGHPGATQGVIFSVGDGSSGNELNYVWNDTLWHHVAGTYNGSAMKLFVDGEFRGQKDCSLLSSGNDITFGSRGNLAWPFEGKIDEVAIWNDVRTVDEIRAYMHLTLKGTETDLVSYWQFNTASGQIAADAIGENSGLLTNMNISSCWIESPIPVGDGQSETQIVSTPGNLIFTNAGMQMNITQKTGTDTIVVSRINLSPNILPSGNLQEVFNSQYWVVNAYGDGTFSADPDFKLQEDLTSGDESHPERIELFTRASNADTAWAYLKAAVSVSATSDSAFFQGLTSFSQFIVVRGVSIDDYPGTTLEFDGVDDYVNCGIEPQITGNNPRSIEAWAYTKSFNKGGIFQAGITGDNGGDFTLRTTENINEWRVQLWGVDFDVTLPHSINSWHHYCLTYDGSTVCLYYDGKLAGSNTVALNTGSHDVYFGRWRDDYFDGKIDEVRFWDIALDTIRIRENMHLSLSKTEAGLLNYWQFNSEIGSQLPDAIAGNHGTLNNMTNDDWVESSIPFGNGVSNSQIETAGAVDFPGTGLSMYYNSQNGASVTTSKIDTIPNMIPAGKLEIFDSQYWVAKRYGTGGFNADLTFTVSEDLTITDENNPSIIQLYTRGSTADTAWAFLKTATSVDAANNKATFQEINSFSQLIIVRKPPGILALLKLPLDFQLIDWTFNSIDVGDESSPVFTDIDGNNLLDLIIGNNDGKLYHYKQDAINSGSFSLVTNNFNSIDVGSRSSPVFTDIDGDGLLDLIVGEDGGKLYHYEQDGINSGSFSFVTNNFNSIDVYVKSSPTFTDIDGDDLLDLIIGDTWGNLTRYEQTNINSGSFSFVTDNFNSIDVGNWGTPTFTDISGDGLLDLIIGETQAKLYHYEQNAVNSGSFSFITNSFSSISVGSISDPEFTNYNNDNRLDLIIGELGGHLRSYAQTAIESHDFGKIHTTDSAITMYLVKADSLLEDLSLNCNVTGFSISLTENSGFTQNINLTPLNGSIRDTIYVKFKPEHAMEYTCDIVHSSTGTLAKHISLSGTGIRKGTPSPVPGTCLEFDGVNDFVNCGTEAQIIGNNPRTIEAWAYAKSFNNGGIFQAGKTGTKDWDFSFTTSTTDNLWRVSFVGSDINITLPNSKNSWHHYCLTYDGAAFYLYYDGSLVNSKSIALNTNSHDVYFGRWDDNYFDGKIDEVRFWDIALDSIQIRENMYRTLTGNETGLADYWQFNDGNGSTLSEIIMSNNGTLQNMDDNDWVTSTAPLPFQSIANGNWGTSTTWDEGQGIPEKDWSRVQINNDVILAQNETMIDLSIESGAILNIPSSSQLSVSGELETNTGNPGLILESDASATASLIHENDSVEATVERYIPKYENTAGWHYLSSPMISQAIQPEFVADPPNSSNDFFKFSEPDYLWLSAKDNSGNWNPAFENNFVVGRGYNIAYDADATKLFEGELNAGDFTFDGTTTPAITYTESGGIGWNLMGNPYPSGLDWDECSRTNIDGSVYVFDGDAGQYFSWNGTIGGLDEGIIPPMNGFFIKAAENPSLTVPNDARAHTTTNFLKSKELIQDLLVLKVEGNGFSDHTYIHFNPDATKDFDNDFDAYKLSGISAAPKFYTTIGNINLSINELPYSTEEITIPLSLKVDQDDEYTISVAQNTFWETVDISLKDLENEIIYKLTTNTQLTINHSPGNSPDRFLLLINGATGIEENTPKNGIEIYSYENQVFIILDEQGEVEVCVYNLLGQKVLHSNLSGFGNLTELKPGYYLITVKTDEVIKTKKVFMR